ncbi:hypothetical protein RB195_022773 [Necator americanus]|uniref:Uncharacterized protein n=1 Tax=Necator americanus TaxID=51031 RepID=A0ABR1EGI2_NECAM
MQLVKTLPTTLLLLALLALFNASVEAVSTRLPSVRTFSCRSSKGVELTSFNAQKYELCAGECCIVKEKSPKKETIQLPPEITLQDYFIQWEISDGHQATVVEATCPQVPFCENVQYWFCTANVLNPKCSPRAAIIVIAIGFYLTTTLIYVLCYVPVRLGIPCRILCKILDDSTTSPAPGAHCQQCGTRANESRLYTRYKTKVNSHIARPSSFATRSTMPESIGSHLSMIRLSQDCVICVIVEYV